jgi:hypothetical protein
MQLARLFGAQLTVAWVCLAAGQVGVLVLNLSAVPAGVLTEAESACREIFSRAGIDIQWMNGVGDVTWEGPDVVLRAAILPRAPVRRRMDVFGSALPNAKSGIQMFLFFDRLVSLSRFADLPVPRCWQERWRMRSGIYCYAHPSTRWRV